jgi:hypothetical protein
VISSSQRPLSDNTQHLQQTNLHAPRGIRTHNLSSRAATDQDQLNKVHYTLQIGISFKYHIKSTFPCFNPFRSYVRPRPTLWFSCSRRFSLSLTLPNPIFLPPSYSPALIYFGRERGWWVTCNYPTVLKEKNINRNRKNTTCAICWLKSVLHEEKRGEQENHFPVPDAFPHVIRTLANK